MTNFGAKIINSAISGLQANQALIATTGNNIANVNTPGYSRRVVQLEVRPSSSDGGPNVGSGVDIGRVQRVTDEYLTKVVQGATSKSASSATQHDLLKRIEPLFSLTGENATIGSSLTAFFTAANDLALDPSSIELRSNFLSKANDLTTTLKSSYTAVASLQRETDDRLAGEVTTINTLTGQIAELNVQISKSEGGDNVANDERDLRGKLLQDLAKKISFTTVEQNDGSVQVVLPNGFALVSGSTSRTLTVTKTPSFDSSPAPALDGGTLNYITYNYGTSASPADLNLTDVLGGGEGEVAGLLITRGVQTPTDTSAFQASGPLVAVASRIEGITRTLLTSVNQTYLGPDRDAGTVGHQASSADLDGQIPSQAFGLFDFEYSGAKDSTGTAGYPESADLTATGIDSFTRSLHVEVTNVRDIAAARDASGGAPAAAEYNPGDGKNMEAIGALQFNNSLSFSVGSYSHTGTFDTAYNETVVYLGGQVATAASNSQLFEDQLATSKARESEISGVSLDEEFAKLVTSQRAYSASARMIKIAGDLLDAVVALV